MVSCDDREMTIAVTGVTGRVGGRVAHALSGQGVPVRLLVRDPRRAPELDGATVRVAVYGRDCAPALEGVATLLMVSGSENLRRVAEHRAFIDDAAEAGVEHVVYTSFVGAGPDAAFLLARDHGDTEEALRASGMRWTMLRDNIYLDDLARWVGEDGAIRGPAGDGRLAGVAIDDVARVAVAALLDPRRHAGRTYELTGPEALSLDEVAATIEQATGRAVRYVRETHEEAIASRASHGAAEWQVAAWISTYTAIERGELGVVSGDVERITGQPALDLASVLARNPLTI